MLLVLQNAGQKDFPSLIEEVGKGNGERRGVSPPCETAGLSMALVLDAAMTMVEDSNNSKTHSNLRWFMSRFCLATLMAALLSTSSILAQNGKITVLVTNGTKDSSEDVKNIPVVVPLELPPKLAKATHLKVLNLANIKKPLVGQLTAPGLLTEGIQAKDKTLVRRDLHFIIPFLNAFTSSVFILEPLDALPASSAFHWQEKKGESIELLRGDKPVLRYMMRAYDNSSTANRNKTYKVFHHLYDPTGKILVTNGGETDPDADKVKLTYPHHRGLMFAFNKITYDQGKTADVWHAKPKDTHQSHEGVLAFETGLVLGRHRVAIDWHGPDQEVFAKEEREMAVYGVDGGTLVEFASRLKTAGGKVKLDGDPQHAGFQFRAANAVAEKTAKQTYFLRPDGKGKPGETRNWDPKNKGPVNLPWDAMSFVLAGKRYTVAYLDSPNNPGEKRYSERDYGRFGCYFEYELTPEHPLVLNHRIWLQEGEMTGTQVEKLSKQFAAPPTVQTAVKNLE
jgi:hypothetical protein